MAQLRCAAVLLPLLCGVVGASIPVHLPSFVNYYEVYMEPYATVKLDTAQSYIATLGMLYLLVMGTLGYLPLNLKDVAKIIDGKRSRRRNQFGGRPFSRRRGWAAGARRRARRRGRRAAGDRHTVEQLLYTVDPDNCVLELICEAEFVGPHQASSVEERLVHRLFSGGAQHKLGSLWQAAQLGRTAKQLGSQRSPCSQLSPDCEHRPPPVTQRSGSQWVSMDNAEAVAAHRHLLQRVERALSADDSPVERISPTDESRIVP